MYDFLKGAKHPVRCKQCGTSFNLNSRTSLHYLLKHEDAEKHQRSIPSKQPESGDAVCQRDRPCRGLDLSAAGQGCKAALLQESMCNWLHAGSPMFRVLPGENTHAEEATWAVRNEHIWLRSKFCQSDSVMASSACSCCLALANSKPLAQFIAGWSYRIDLAVYVSHLVASDDKQSQSLREQISARDYMTSSLAGSDFKQLCAQDTVRQVCPKKCSVCICFHFRVV